MYVFLLKSFLVSSVCRDYPAAQGQKEDLEGMLVIIYCIYIYIVIYRPSLLLLVFICFKSHDLSLLVRASLDLEVTLACKAPQDLW